MAGNGLVVHRQRSDNPNRYRIEERLQPAQRHRCAGPGLHPVGAVPPLIEGEAGERARPSAAIGRADQGTRRKRNRTLVSTRCTNQAGSSQCTWTAEGYTPTTCTVVVPVEDRIGQGVDERPNGNV